MKTKIVMILFILFGFLQAQESFNKTSDETYLRNYAKIAVEEMQLYKIPASITLGQGLLETADGQSRLAKQANNHFGIKCKKEWKGKKIYHDDDAKGECFRKYDKPWDSFRDHSKFLAERPYYKKLFTLDILDYKAWSYGLKRAGYATNPRYPQILIGKIERYKLYEFDKLKPSEVNAKLNELYPHSVVIKEPKVVEEAIEVKPAPIKVQKKPILKAPEKREHPIERIKKSENRLKYVTIYEGETLFQLSKLYKIPTHSLKSFNDIKNESKIKSGERVYLQKKKSKGSKKLHIVKENETMLSISQLEGIKLKSLYKRNRMKIGSEPKKGQTLYLKGKVKKK